MLYGKSLGGDVSGPWGLAGSPRQEPVTSDFNSDAHPGIFMIG